MAASVRVRRDGGNWEENFLQFYDGGISIPKEFREKLARYPEIDSLWKVIISEQLVLSLYHGLEPRFKPGSWYLNQVMFTPC